MAPLIDHDRIAEVYEGTLGSREFQQASRRRIHWMGARVVGPDVLDVGCSQGITSILLGREGHRVVGLDREHEAIRAARERLDQEEPQVRERVAFQIGEAGDLPFPDESFDTVLLGEVLEHQLDPARPLEEATRVLRPGGRLVITTPYGIHPYPDHKDPLYLGPLLARLSPRLSIAEIDLVDRYVGVVAERSKDHAPGVWRRALGVAERRLEDQDEALETLRGLVSELREGARTLERSAQDQDLTRKATEIQRDAATQRMEELHGQLLEVEERAATAIAQRDSALRDLEEARTRIRSAELERAAAADRTHELEAERKASAREIERLQHAVRGASERLHSIELGQRTARADLESAKAQKEEAEAKREEVRAELEDARVRVRELELEREMAARETATLSRETAALKERAREADSLRARLAALEETSAAATEEAARAREELREHSARQAGLADQLLHVELELEHERARASDLERRLEERDVAAGQLERLEAQLERVEAQLSSARTQLAEARRKTADLVADREAALDAAQAAKRTADEAHAGLEQLGTQAAREAREAVQRAEELRTEADGLRVTVDSLSREGTALRSALQAAEGQLGAERKLRREWEIELADLKTRLEDAALDRTELEEELASIRGRFGYRVGRFLRGPFGGRR